jgi:hypothetical protein
MSRVNNRAVRDLIKLESTGDQTMTSAGDKKYPWLSLSDESITPVSREDALRGLREDHEPSTMYVVVHECQELKDKGDTTSSVISNEAANLYGESIPPWHSILLHDDLMLLALESHLRKGHQLIGYFKVNLDKALADVNDSLDTLKMLLEDMIILGRPSSAVLSKLSQQN